MRRALQIAFGLPLLAGCYRVTVVAGAPPSAVTVDRPWQHSFIGGLVPPNEVNVQELCPNGVARVVTERSFVNGVADVVTSGIYSPIHTMVTCASGPVRR
jgi:Bor protein